MCRTFPQFYLTLYGLIYYSSSLGRIFTNSHKIIILTESISTEWLPNTGLRDLRSLLHKLADGKEPQRSWPMGARAAQGLTPPAPIPRRLQRPQHGTRETRTIRTRQEDKQTFSHSLKTQKNLRIPNKSILQVS